LTALRDSNLPKFLTDDAILFKAILSDLFPGVLLEDYDYGSMQTAIEFCCEEKGLTACPEQVAKVIQFYETMVVRHGVMLVGPTGGGKTTCLEVLQKALTKLWDDGEYETNEQYKKVNTYVMNPKSVTMGELYGEVNFGSGEWTDGLMATKVRDCVNAGNENEEHQWIVCDGPVDALWIENMNTVLDDNKMLCLANSERIKLTPWMHMVFEVQDLAVASPATVSRCGMVYVDPSDMNWQPYFERWLLNLGRLGPELKTFLGELFHSHITAILYYVRKNYTVTMEQVDIGKVATLCTLLEQLIGVETSKLDVMLTEDNADDIHAGIVICFLFATTWAIGGNLNQQFHEPFDTYIREEFADTKGARIPGLGLMYDFYVNFEQTPPAFDKWEAIVPKFTYSLTMEYFDMLVPTTSTIKHSFLLETMTAANQSTLFTGLTGVGKSVVAVNCLAQLEEKGSVIPVTMNFSAQTTALQTQEIIESKLEKKGKTRLGAPAGKKIVIFVDDLNMPKLDEYGSQPPVELLRQYQDYKGFYDREKLFWKDVKDLVLCAGCAPPGGGRNPITPRLIRHFAMFSLPKPDDLALKTIFTQILQGYLVASEFAKPLQNMAKNIIDAGAEIYNRMAEELLPTPDKSHYLFNLRDLSKVVQGILQADQQVIREETQLFELFCHESLRVFHDRLTTKEDKTYYCGMLAEMASKHFRKTMNGEDFQNTPIIFGDYMKPGAAVEDRQYERLENDKLAAVLGEYLDTYNMESTKEMNLVFFNDAIEHVSRIARMIRQPRGNALLVGVGGTGKQSLTRMACVMGGFTNIQIEITRGYGHVEFREDLKRLYMAAGTKGEEVVFLFTDNQIVDESFLEDINNILNSGEVPNLFEPEEVERYIGPCRPLAKEAGLPETRDAVFGFFINRVRQHLHVVLCMSPVGSAFRSRCRMFPSLVNCCTIDWFTEWPEEALQSVSTRFFEFVDLGTDEMKSKISAMCVVIHTSVSEMAEKFYDELRRRYYTTPTSYLELINLYTAMLSKKRQELMLQKDRYASGMKKLMETDELIGTMEIELTALTPILEEKSAATAELMINVKKEEAETQKVSEVVAKEEAMAMKEAEATEAIKADAQKDLDLALPALAGAQKALEALDKKDIQEIKSFAKPPELVELTLAGVCILFPKITGGNVDWKSAKALLNEGDLMKWLFNYDKDNVSDKTLKKLKKYIDDPRFQPDIVAKTSTSCKSLCLWVRAIDLYSHVYRTVEPKRAALNEAETSLAKTQGELAKKQATLKQYTDKIKVLQKQFKESVDAKESLEKQAQLTKDRLRRAGQLQTSLGSEKIRWKESVESFEKQLVDVIGNVFLGSACVAYFGAFTSKYRVDLVDAWSAKCDELKIPRSEGMGLADILSDAFQIRGWNANALPNDTLSIENAVLVTQGRRWPLMIDPQDQANTWIRTMERRNGLKVIKLTDGDFLRTLENCIRTGTPCLLEEVQEVLDPSLEPILLKQTFTQGGRLLIRLGDSDVDYDKNFRFYMTTKLNNPHYLPEICIKVTIINFTVTKIGLEDQLLGDVVRLERPDLAEKRTKLIMAINEDKAQLKSIEDKILKLLFNSEGNILDDEVLISTLGESKITSTAINGRLIEAEQTEIGITEARNKYKPVAIRGAIVFFVISDVGLIDEMYQYSLGYFKNLFVLCIENSEKSSDLDTRLQTIVDFSTVQIFTNISRGLFERHKLVFSFLTCAEIMRGRGDIDIRTWNYYLRGAGAGDRVRPPKPGGADDFLWLSQVVWDKVVDLETSLPHLWVVVDDEDKPLGRLTEDLVARPFSVTIGSLTVCINDDIEWEGCAAASAVDWNTRLNDFEKVLLIKTVKPSMIIDATLQFVAVNLGPAFVESVAIDLEVVYKDLTKETPLIFVLSTGSDPMSSFQRFALKLKMDDKYDAISLGQGQGPVAEKMVATAVKEGRWVFLQNCHLCKSWMNGMEVMIKGFSAPDAKVHADFRLYLSSMPCNFFPIGVLQNAVKVTNEPPKGLRANIRASFNSVDPVAFAENPLGLTYRKLIFGLCFFHANIQERKKFGPLGWNISYGFSTTDLETTLANLKIFLEEQGEVPWDALTYLIGEIYYGGRVTDAWDLRTLGVILRRFFVEKSLEPGFTYSESGIYYPAAFDTAPEYVQYIESFPFSDAPDIFGLHENANLAFLRAETASLISNVLSVQPRLTTSGAEKTPDDIVFEVAEMIQEKVRQTLIDVDEAKEGTFDRDPTGQVKSLSTVLKQEIDRFNILLVMLWDSLKNLKKAIKGLVVMSSELEEIYTGFINNTVPKLWSSHSYPSLQPLGAWVTDLVKRMEFIQSWLVDGQPASFWMSGFYYTQGFLTGTLQEHARRYAIPIDTLTFKFEVHSGLYIDPGQTIEDSGVVLPKITSGVLTHGIFMEAFRWDDNAKMLADSNPGEMIAYLPVVHMSPVPNFTIPKEDYNSPMYKTNFRQGMLSTTGHSTNFVVPIHFPTDKDPGYWINKGAALLCQNVLG
jgi:dynein heavy chain